MNDLTDLPETGAQRCDALLPRVNRGDVTRFYLCVKEDIIAFFPSPGDHQPLRVFTIEMLGSGFCGVVAFVCSVRRC